MPEADALRLARRKFLAAQRIDMTALASELGVNRVTLYRWVGSRDALMVEVLWSLAAPTLAGADAAVRARGGVGAGQRRRRERPQDLDHERVARAHPAVQGLSLIHI